MDSFHKKSQYVIVASKIIRPNTFYQVSSPNLWRNDIQHNGTRHNDTEHKDTQYNGLICDTHHK